MPNWACEVVLLIAYVICEKQGRHIGGRLWKFLWRGIRHAGLSACKSVKQLVAGGGFEPPTFGL